MNGFQERLCVIPILKQYPVLPLSMTAPFTLSLSVWPFRTTKNIFDFPQGRTTHLSNYFWTSVLTPCLVTNFQKKKKANPLLWTHLHQIKRLPIHLNAGSASGLQTCGKHNPMSRCVGQSCNRLTGRKTPNTGEHWLHLYLHTCVSFVAVKIMH